MHSIQDLWRHNELALSRMLSSVFLSSSFIVIPSTLFPFYTAAVISTDSDSMIFFPSLITDWKIILVNILLLSLFESIFRNFANTCLGTSSGLRTWWLSGNIWSLVVNGYAVILASPHNFPENILKTFGNQIKWSKLPANATSQVQKQRY